MITRTIRTLKLNKISKNTIYLFCKKFDSESVCVNKNSFSNEKLAIIETKLYNKSVFPLYMYGVIYPGIAYTGYKAIIKLVSLKIFGSIFYFGLLGVFLFLRRTLFFNSSNFILNINLMSDGKRVSVSTMTNNFIADISSIRKLTNEEKVAFENIYASRIRNFIPIVISENIYFINNKVQILNKEVLSSISNGKYIIIAEDESSQSNTKNDTIDI